MGDVVSIEVDGELGPPSFDHERRPPRWGPPVAVVLVVGLVAAIAVTASRSGTVAPAASPSTTAAEVTPPSTSPSTVPPTTPTTLAPVGPVESAELALAAWGRFAGSGDLAELAGFFDADGDQMLQLQAELGSISPGPPYLVTLGNAASVEDDETATVTGDVVWARSGEPDQHYRWAVDLRRTASGWAVDTVRTAR